MSAPECTCEVRFTRDLRPYIKHCPLHAAAAQMYERLDALTQACIDNTDVGNHHDDFCSVCTETVFAERVLADARGETERVR